MRRAPGPVDSPPHWLIRRRVLHYPLIVLVMFTIAATLYSLTFSDGLDGQGRPPGTDFVAFWSAAQLHAAGETATAWDIARLSAFQAEQFPGLTAPTAWVYPPTMLLLVAPLGSMPYLLAFLTWTVAGLACFLGSLAPLLRRRESWIIALAFPGIWMGIAHGQTQFVVGALLGGCLIVLDRRPVLAGVLLGLLVVKPHLALLMPLALISGRHWRTFAAAAVTATSFMAGSAAWFGVDTVRAWISGMGLVATKVDEGVLPVYKFVTPYTSLRLVGLPESVALGAHAVVAVVAAWVVWKVWRRTSDIRLRGSAVVFSTFLVTPYAADYDLALLAFPIAWLALVGLQDGWLRGERNLLVILWCLPMVVGAVGAATHVSVTPFVMGLGLWSVWRRVNRVDGDDRGRDERAGLHCADEAEASGGPQATG